jgi:hypothetical protein
MSTAMPNPNSVVLEATHILLLRIETAQISEWSNLESGMLVRSVTLEVELLRVLKGEVEQSPGERFTLPVTQYSSGSPRNPSAPGVWSNVPLDEGTELLAFCKNRASRQLTELLQETSCLEVIAAHEEVDDVELALEAERQNLSPAALLAMAEPHASKLGYIFTRYLWTKVARPAAEDPATFDALMNFIELPQLSLITRWSLLSSVNSAITLLSPPPLPQYYRLVISLFRLIAVAGDPTVTANIIQVFLPNLLGIHSGLPLRKAQDVFRDYPDERPKAEQTLRSYQGSASTNHLLAWMAQGS